MTSKYITELELMELDAMVCGYWRRANRKADGQLMQFAALGYLYGLQDGVRSLIEQIERTYPVPIEFSSDYSELDSELSLLLDIISIREGG